MESPREVEFVSEPQDEAGYHVYAPELPGLHTQGDSLEEATENAREALALYVEGLREDGRRLDSNGNGQINSPAPLRDITARLTSSRGRAGRLLIVPAVRAGWTPSPSPKSGVVGNQKTVPDVLIEDIAGPLRRGQAVEYRLVKRRPR